MIVGFASVLLLGIRYLQPKQFIEDTTVAAQAGGCPTQDTDTIGFPKGYFVNYDVSRLPDTSPYNVKTQVKTAIGMWNTAARASCLNIGFVEAGPGQPVDLTFIRPLAKVS